MEITKDKLIQIINLYEKSKEMYQAINQVDEIPYFAEKNLLIIEDLNQIIVDTFILHDLIIYLFDLPEDNSYKYFQYFAKLEYKKENFKGMVCHDPLIDYCWKWFDGEITTEQLADEIIDYVKVFKEGNK